jgi:hypothetical protein
MKRTEELYVGDLEWDEPAPQSTIPAEKYNDFDWMDKATWLLKGFIIGAAMTAFMSFVMV